MGGQSERLSADAATGFQNPASGRVVGVAVQEVDQGVGLVLQAQVFLWVVAMYVLLEHRHRLDHLHQKLRVAGAVDVGATFTYGRVLHYAEGVGEAVAELMSSTQVLVQFRQVCSECRRWVWVLFVQ